MRALKEWLVRRYLPAWAKHTILEDNAHLAQELDAARREAEQLRAYLRGLERSLRVLQELHITVNGGTADERGDQGAV